MGGWEKGREGEGGARELLRRAYPGSVDCKATGAEREDSIHQVTRDRGNREGAGWSETSRGQGTNRYNVYHLIHTTSRAYQLKQKYVVQNNNSKGGRDGTEKGQQRAEREFERRGGESDEQPLAVQIPMHIGACGTITTKIFTSGTNSDE